MTEDLADKIFEIRSRYLGAIPHPMLIGKGIKELQALNIQVPESKAVLSDADLPLFEYLDAYTALSLQIKLEISSSDDPEALMLALVRLRTLQWEMIEKLSSYWPDETALIDDIRISTAIDTHRVQIQLQGLQLEETEISTYISTADTKELALKSTLVTEIMRARKTVNHGRQV